MSDGSMQREMSKDAMAPLELLRESKSSIEEIISRMLSIKNQGLPKSENRELLTQMFLNFINLRQVRNLIIRVLLHQMFSLFLQLVGESCDSDGRRESEKRERVIKVSNGSHFIAASQSHVREEPLPQSHQIFQRVQIQVPQHRSHIRTRLLQRRSRSYQISDALKRCFP